jgi:hypothetical protein
MATKRLPMHRLRDVLRLKFETRPSHRAIARSCSLGVGTVSKHVSRAQRAGLGWPLAENLDDRPSKQGSSAETDAPPGAHRPGGGK